MKKNQWEKEGANHIHREYCGSLKRVFKTSQHWEQTKMVKTTPVIDTSRIMSWIPKNWASLESHKKSDQDIVPGIICDISCGPIWVSFK